MKCRKATPADLQELSALCVYSVSKNVQHPFKTRPDVVKESLASFMTPSNFVWVTEDDAGVLVAGVVALAQPSIWMRGMQCSVMMFCAKSPGCGMPLLREFARWVKSRPGIKTASFFLEPEADPRIGKALKRMGFDSEATYLTYVRGI